MNKSIYYATVCIILIVCSSAAYAQSYASEYGNAPNIPYSFSPETLNTLGQDFKSSLSQAWTGITTGYSSLMGYPLDLGEAIIVNVEDYEPKIVRSSLIEQQNVPVFITLKGTTFGTMLSPFTDDVSQEDVFTGIRSIPPIKRVDIEYDKKDNRVLDVHPYAPRDSGYSLDNLGYLIVTLKKIENESQGETIDINLSAKIYLDLAYGGLFNLGPESLSLSSEPNENAFLNKINKDSNSFFGGKGFVRAANIESNAATFVVYDKDARPLSSLMPGPYIKPYNPLSTVRLKEGETSGVIRFDYMGNPLTDFMRIRLDSIASADDRAVFDIDVYGKTERKIVMKNKQIYPNSDWKLTSISKVNIGNKNKKWLLENGFSSVAIEGINTDVPIVEHKAIIENYNTGQRKAITKYVIGGISQLNLDIKDINSAEAMNLEMNYCGDLTKLDENQNNYGCMAVKRLKKIAKEFPDIKELKDVYKMLAEIYMKKLIGYNACDVINTNPIQVRNLASCKKYKDDMDKLAWYYLNLIKDSYPNLIADYQNDLIGSVGMDYLEDAGIPITLRYVETMDETNKGRINYRVDRGLEIKDVKIGEILSIDGKSAIGGKDENKNFVWKISEIYPRYIKVKQWFENTQSYGKEFSLYLGQINQLPVEMKKGTYYGSDTTQTRDIEILDIHTDLQAFATIIPGAGDAYTTSNFTVHIPIEKRPFSFTPDQIKAQIDAVNAVVDKLDGIIDKLDSVVRTWKKICILTFAALTIKNSVFGGSARVVARRNVGEYYKKECIDQADKYSSVDECLYEKRDDIEKAVDVEEQVLENVDKSYKDKGIEKIGKENNDAKKFFDMGGSLEQYKRCEEYKKLKTEFKDDGYSKFIDGKYSDIGCETKIKEYDEAKNVYDALIDDQKKDLGGQQDEGKVIPNIANTIALSKTSIINKEGTVVLNTFTPKENNAASGLTYSNQKAEFLDLVRPSQDQCEKWQLSKEKGTSPCVADGYDIYVKKGSEGSTTKPMIYLPPFTLKDGLKIGQYSEAQKQNMIAEYGTDSYPYCVPTGENGEYVYVYERYKTGEPSRFEIRNVGPNGLIECNTIGDDQVPYTWDLLNSGLPQYQKLQTKYRSFVQGLGQCSEEGKVLSVSKGMQIRCSSKGKSFAESLKEPRCIDVMDPSDCQIMFNACDPVMCPTSRCNLGGRYRPSNVIQSGLIGSIVLCAPNIKQGIYIPVCLTGILASLNNLRSYLQGYADCLDINLKSGKNVGICDYIRSVGICELVWREVISIIQMRGGLIDLFTGKIDKAVSGGGEYLSFKQSLDNVGSSFNYFTSDYKNSFLAYYKGKSTQEIGSQVCRLQIAGKLPSFGEILDKLSEPENPPQFTAFFDSAPYMQSIGEAAITGVPYGTKELTEYRIFYQIYAGTGFPEEVGLISTEGVGFADTTQQGKVSYMVYLQGTGLPPLYVTDSSNWATSRKTLERGESTIQTVNKIGAKGYTEICVVLNNHKECGFSKVSSSFAFDYASEQLAAADATTKNITTAEECSPDFPKTSLALGGISTPEQYGLLSTGIIRVCSTTVPSADQDRWVEVGTCGKDPDSGSDQGKCWLDKNSISIEDSKTKKEVYDSLTDAQKKMAGAQVLSADESAKLLELLNKERDRIIGEISKLVEAEKISDADYIKLQNEKWKTIAEQAKAIVAVPKTVEPTTQLELAWNDISKTVSGEPGGQYNDLINSIGIEVGVSPALIKAIIARESNFNPTAKSSVGCIGLMQLCYGVDDNNNEIKIVDCSGGACNTMTDYYDDEKNIRAGAKYIKRLFEHYKYATIENVLIAYNAGTTNTPRGIDWSENCKKVNNCGYVNDIINNFKKYAGGVSGTKLVWPLPDFPNIEVPKCTDKESNGNCKTCSITNRCFGSERDNGQRRHAGIDLYSEGDKLAGTKVVAIEPGVVTNVYHFEEGTCAVLVYNQQKDRTINYGEVGQCPKKGILNLGGLFSTNDIDVKKGDNIKAGQQIGKLYKMGNEAMLHLELYNGKVEENKQWTTSRPGELLDPESLLESIKKSLSPSVAVAQIENKQTSATSATYVASELEGEAPNPSDPFEIATASAEKTSSGYAAKLATYFIQLANNIITKLTSKKLDVDNTYYNSQLMSNEVSTKKRVGFGFVVLHDGGSYSYCKEDDGCAVKSVLNQWAINKDSNGNYIRGESTHYYIGCSGKIFPLVPEDVVAIHVGCKSTSYGCTYDGMNYISVGIDLRNCAFMNNKIPYTDKQYSALNQLLNDLKERKIIKGVNDLNVVGHFEVYSGHDDPVNGFSWSAIGLNDHREKSEFIAAVKSKGGVPVGEGTSIG